MCNMFSEPIRIMIVHVWSRQLAGNARTQALTPADATVPGHHSRTVVVHTRAPNIHVFE